MPGCLCNQADNLTQTESKPQYSSLLESKYSPSISSTNKTKISIAAQEQPQKSHEQDLPGKNTFRPQDTCHEFFCVFVDFCASGM